MGRRDSGGDDHGCCGLCRMADAPGDSAQAPAVVPPSPHRTTLPATLKGTVLLPFPLLIQPFRPTHYLASPSLRVFRVHPQHRLSRDTARHHLHTWPRLAAPPCPPNRRTSGRPRRFWCPLRSRPHPPFQSSRLRNPFWSSVTTCLTITSRSHRIATSLAHLCIGPLLRVPGFAALHAPRGVVHLVTMGIGC